MQMSARAVLGCETSAFFSFTRCSAHACYCLFHLLLSCLLALAALPHAFLKNLIGVLDAGHVCPRVDIALRVG